MIKIIQGDWNEQLRTLEDSSVHCCVTSPPYWGLRDYGVPGQLGLEKTPEEYVEKLVAGFREVRRVLRDDGTLWLNLGDSYTGGVTLGRNDAGRNFTGGGGNRLGSGNPGRQGSHDRDSGLKPKDLVGIPWRTAFALQADGWYLRSEIIWAKRNCMPESVTDRPTKAHEQIFLLSKSERYYYDAEAVKQPASDSYANDSRWDTGGTETNCKLGYADAMAQNPKMPHRVFNGERRTTVNLRDVWHLATEPYKESHFATFPNEIPRRSILAGTSAKGCCPLCGAPWGRILEQEGSIDCGGYRKRADAPGAEFSESSAFRTGKIAAVRTAGWEPGCDCGHGKLVPATVLDPFGGSGTTGQVALELGRKAVLIELNPKYIELAERRTNVTPGFMF